MVCRRKPVSRILVWLDAIEALLMEILRESLPHNFFWDEQLRGEEVGFLFDDWALAVATFVARQRQVSIQDALIFVKH